MVAATVRADAPVGQYAEFSGGDITIVDNFTGLTWSRAIQTATTFSNAQSVCQNPLKVVDANGVGGFRLPTLKELLTLVDEGTNRDFQGGTVLRAIDLNAFPKTPAGPFWTVTRSDSVGSGGPPAHAYAVSFDTGDVVSKAASESLVFHCVR